MELPRYQASQGSKDPFAKFSLALIKLIWIMSNKASRIVSVVTGLLHVDIMNSTDREKRILIGMILSCILHCAGVLGVMRKANKDFIRLYMAFAVMESLPLLYLGFLENYTPFTLLGFLGLVAARDCELMLLNEIE